MIDRPLAVQMHARLRASTNDRLQHQIKGCLQQCHATTSDQNVRVASAGHASEIRCCAANNPTLSLTTNYSQWMMVPQSLITLDGTVCNLVGTSYTAFLNQPVRLAASPSAWYKGGQQSCQAWLTFLASLVGTGTL